MYVRILVIILLSLIGPANANTLRAGGLGAVTKLLPVLYAGFGEAATF
jgi:hypothetical protein